MASDIVRSDSLPQTSRWKGNLSAMHSPAFRLYFAGQLVSVSGTWMQAVAQQVVVYDLTKSEFTLGVVACAQGLPALLLTPFAGVIVERYPKRKLLIFTQTVMMLLAFILAYLQFANILQVWHLVALSFGLGLANALDAPARQAFVVEMVGREHLSSGIVMNSVMFNGARVVGPALGGFALKTVGAGWCFLLNGASFLAVILSLFVMNVPEITHLVGKVDFIKPLKEGFELARHHATIGPLLMMSVITAVFGLTYSVLITPFADQILHDSSGGTSALLAAQGVGAVVAAVVVARANTGGSRGKWMVISAIIAPISVIVLAVTRSYATSLPTIGVAGLAFIAEFVLINTLIQHEVPDEFRGRVLSLYTLTFFGLSPFSNLAIGLLANTITTVTAMALFGFLGLVCILLVVWRAPQLWKMH